MNIHWIPVNTLYHQIIDASDAVEKLTLYQQHFLTPWAAMMKKVGAMFGAAPDDELSVARAWAWPLPADLNQVPVILAQLEAAEAWKIGENALRTACELFIHHSLPFDTVEGWLMIGMPERSNPIGQGYTGSIDHTQPRFMCQYDTLTERNLRALPGAVVHEFHHLVRLSLFPWDMRATTVAEYIVHEGLAESFATALFGAEVLGYYVTDISEANLATARRLIVGGLDRSGFNVIRGYIFGDTLAEKFGFERIGMPDYGGYAVGYHVVQAYLARTGKTIEETTLEPADEIVRGSGYFV